MSPLSWDPLHFSKNIEDSVLRDVDKQTNKKVNNGSHHQILKF